MSRNILKNLFETVMPFGIFLQRTFIVFDLLDKKKKFILDIGCGDGYISNFLTRCGKKVVAIDSDKTNLRRKFTFLIADAERLPFKNSTFDQILSMDVMEHIQNDELAAKEMGRILKKNGAIIITTPSKFWRFPFYSFMKPITPSERKLLKSFGHVRKGYDITRIKKLFKKFKIDKVEYFVNRPSALFFDLEYSKLFFIKNIILRILGPLLFLNFRLSKRKCGTFLGVRLIKIRN